MDRRLFDGDEGWAKVMGLEPRLAQAFYIAMKDLDNADMILRAAAKRKMTPQKMVDLLKTQKAPSGQMVDTTQIEALLGSAPAAIPQAAQAVSPKVVLSREERHAQMRKASSATSPASPVFLPAQPVPQNAPSGQTTVSGQPMKTANAKTQDIPASKALVLVDQAPAEKPKTGFRLPTFVGNLWKRIKKTPVKDKAVGSTNPAQAKPAKKKKGKKWIWWIVGVALLVILAFIGNMRYGVIDFGGASGGLETSHPSAPVVVPDANLTSMTPEEKESWATSRLNSSVTETFLTKPTSFADFFQNFKLYLNWLLYISAILLVSFSIFRERTQAAEFSDIRHYLVGIGVAIVLITFSSIIGQWAFAAGWTTSPLIFQYVSLVVAFLINAVMQYSAYDSGNRDFSVIAAGLYIFGLLLKWWFPAVVMLSTIGLALMLAGLAVQFFEIRRHNDRDSNALTKSVIAAVLMMIVFVVVYVWIFGLLEAQIATFIIPADVTAQAGAALKLSLLVKGQIATSAIVGLVIAYLFGLVYGMIFLPTKGRDGTVDIRNALMLDADASTLFVMILFLFLPWIWILPKYSLLLFG